MADWGQPETARPAILPTILSAYQPIEQYRRLLQSSCQNIAPSPLSIAAIDAFLMQLIATYHPKPLTIIDLAAGATFGTSTFFWAAHSSQLRVVTPRVSWEEPLQRDWRPFFHNAARTLEIDEARCLLSDEMIDRADGWGVITRSVNPLSSILFILAGSEESSPEIPSSFAFLFGLRSDAIILLFPLGPIGSSDLLGSALEFCTAHAGYRLTALREIGPFFGSSMMGMIYRNDNPHIPGVIERIRQLYDGNFQFLNLVQTATTTVLREEAAQEALVAKDKHLTNLEETLVAKDKHLTNLEETLVAKDKHLANLEETLVAKDKHLANLEETLAGKQQYLSELESHLNAIEGNLLPWKNGYITNLETYIRNLESSKALKVGRVLQRLVKRIQR